AAADEPGADLADQLDPAVARLSSAQRTVVLLRFYQGLEFEQIAQIIGTTEQAARKQVNRAVARLREMLGGPISQEAIAGAALIGLPPASWHLAGSIHAAIATKTATATAASAAKGAAHLIHLAKLKLWLAIMMAIVIPLSGLSYSVLHH